MYLTCTNNTSRAPGQVDEANPRAANKHGHVSEMTPGDGRHSSERFTWDIVLLAGDPKDTSTYVAGYDTSQVAPICCPDNVTFDWARRRVGRWSAPTSAACWSLSSHPGEVDGASPDAVAWTFPYTGVSQPRPAVIQVFRR